MTVILLPGVGLVNWREFEQNMGWTNFFVIASSLSLANALISSGAAEWFADSLVGSVEGLRGHPHWILLAMAGSAAAVRVVMPNIAGYLAFIIPVAMSTGAALGLNPVVCGLAVVVVGDSVVFYPASATASRHRSCWCVVTCWGRGPGVHATTLLRRRSGSDANPCVKGVRVRPRRASPELRRHRGRQ